MIMRGEKITRIVTMRHGKSAMDEEEVEEEDGDYSSVSWRNTYKCCYYL